MTSVTLIRHIKARPSIVFEAMTTAEGIAHWWGPDEGPVLFANAEPHVGGSFRVRFRLHRAGSEHECYGKFLDLVPYERFALNWRWEGGVEDPGESRIDVTLRPLQEGTEVMFTQSKLANDETRRSHEEGWSGSFEKLQRYCAGLAS